MALGNLNLDAATKNNLMNQLAGISSQYQPANPATRGFQTRAQQIASQLNARTALSDLSQGPSVAAASSAMPNPLPASLPLGQTPLVPSAFSGQPITAGIMNAPAQLALPAGNSLPVPHPAFQSQMAALGQGGGSPQLALPSGQPTMGLPAGSGAIPMPPAPPTMAGAAGGAGGGGVPPTSLAGAAGAAEEGAGGLGAMEGAGARLAGAAAPAEEAAAVAATAGRGAGLLSKLGAIPGVTVPEGMGVMQFAAPAALGAGASLGINALMPHYATPTTTGQMGTNAARTVLADAALGAGIGGTIGTVVPVAGTALGALIGGTAGAIKGGFSAAAGNKSHPDPTVSGLQTAMQQGGLPDTDQAQIMSTYNALTALDPSPAGKEAAKQQVSSMLMDRMQVAQDSNLGSANMLASQAMAQQFMQPLLKNEQDSAQRAAAYQNAEASNLPASLQPIAHQAALDRIDAANADASQYAQQLQTIPLMNALQQQQANLKYGVNSAIRPAIKAAAKGGTSASGSNNLSSILKK